MPELLDDAAVTDALAALPGWTREQDTLVRTAKLPSFAAAINAVVQVAEVAESKDHHPDIDIRWRTLTFRLSTHSAGGLTELDTAVAEAISGIVESAGGS